MDIAIGTPFVVHANPLPLLVSRQAAFPGLVRLDNGELLALISIGQAFDAADMRAHVVRSTDNGRSWSAPTPLHTPDPEAELESESFKPLKLRDGTLIATGYVFVRPDMLTPIVDAETLSVLPMRNKISVSNDSGQTWSPPRNFSVDGAPLELSGPAIELASGRLLAAAAPFHLAENGHEGWIIASDDKGESWTKLSTFFRSPEGAIGAWECRLAEIAPDTVAVLFWAYDNRAQRNLTNHIALSRDGGRSFAPAIDTGIGGQASNLMPLGADRLMSIHCHREPPVGLIVRELALAENSVRVVQERPIFAEDSMGSRTGDIAGQFGSLRFGQPSLLRLSEDEVLAAWWQVENCQHVIKACPIGLGNPAKD